MKAIVVATLIALASVLAGTIAALIISDLQRPFYPEILSVTALITFMIVCYMGGIVTGLLTGWYLLKLARRRFAD